MNDPAERIVEVEFQLAHQQRLYEQLNEVVIEQAQRLVRIERVLARLENQVLDLRETPKMPLDLQDEKPPHY